MPYDNLEAYPGSYHEDYHISVYVPCILGTYASTEYAM